jgi:peptidoglycan/xylan/chitin deacetylase (PgdA/CDA1 family)
VAKDIKLMKESIFTISLDFELMWGVFDQQSIDEYGDNIKGVHSVIPKILELFIRYDIHATWAAVGMLYFESLSGLKENLPILLPSYENKELSAYHHMENINEADFDEFYSGLYLINEIKSTKDQELATHTFAHYYCLELGQNNEQFHADLKQAVNIASVNNVKIKSIIFPRNQFNSEYLAACKTEQIIAYRGNENNFFQKPRSSSNLKYFIRMGRLLDSYINITGYNVLSGFKKDQFGLINIPASSFLRPYNKKLQIFESIKIKRIKNAMLNAAKHGGCFHLWWHPHNFGVNQTENLLQLQEILEYYKFLHKKYDMKSMNMNEIASDIMDIKK